MPLIKGFQSTTIWKAFLLNSIATTVIVFTAIIIKDRLNKYVDIYGRKVEDVSDDKNLLITIGITFVSAIVTYGVLWYVFGFGYGMLAC